MDKIYECAAKFVALENYEYRKIVYILIALSLIYSSVFTNAIASSSNCW